MKIRHRIPSLFSLSMVDVLCCALGCVILLWLVNSREAKHHNNQAGQTKKELDQTTQKLKTIADEFDQTKTLLDDTTKKFSGTTVALDQANAKTVKLQTDLAELLKKNLDLAAALKLKDREHINVSNQLVLSAQQLADLEKLLEGKNFQVSKDKKKIKELEGKLLTAEDLIALLNGKAELSEQQLKNLLVKLEKTDQLYKQSTGKVDASDLEIAKLLTQVKDADKLIKNLEKLVDQLKLDSKGYNDKLTETKTQSTTLSTKLTDKSLELDKSKTKIEVLLKELEDLTKLKKALELQLDLNKLDLTQANSSLSKLQKDKLELLNKATLLQDEMANRFAGIELTGKKVIFLVDTSGSMGMLDTLKPDTKKWPMVCEIIGKIMHSLPEATHYQVITFSDKVSYPLGYKRQWLQYEPKNSAEFVVKQLQKLKPQGGTSMFPAFDEAFFYKIGGLDTIYLISDGLPDPPDEEIPAHIKKMSLSQQSAHFCNEVRGQLKTVWNASVNNKTPVRINAIGFYFDSPEVGAFLWALARENNGNFVGMSKP